MDNNSGSGRIGHSEQELERRIQRHMIEHLFQQMPTVWLGNMLAAGLLVLGLWPSADGHALLLWFAAVVLSLGYRYYLTLRFWRVDVTVHEPRVWGRAATFTSLVQGILWGMAGVLFIASGEVMNQVLIFCFILAISISSISINGYWIQSFFAFTVPATLLLAVRMFLEQDLEHLVLAIALVLYNLVTASLAWGTSRSLRESIRLRFENIDLLEELRQASDSKTRFLAAASHDLRQPVHAFTLFTEALRSEVHTERGHDLLRHINEALDAHSGLLNSLLDISKLDAGVVVPKTESVPLEPLFELLSRELQPLAEQKGLQFRVHPCRRVVHSDPCLLANILRNLVTNAIRYTERGGILLGCRQHGERVRIEVWDTGVGIASQEQERVFEEFSQLHNPERDRSKGLGLGLAICRRLSDLLEHELCLDSVPGQGSVFRLWVVQEPTQLCSSSKRGVSTTANALGTQLRGRRIMVIDDDHSVLEGMREVLSAWGMEVALADSVEAAVAHAREQQPELIVADYRLREHTTGIEAVEAVEAVREVCGKSVPALLVTADTARERLQEVREKGLLLLHKPIQPMQLRLAIEEVLRKLSVSK